MGAEMARSRAKKFKKSIKKHSKKFSKLLAARLRDPEFIRKVEAGKRAYHLTPKFRKQWARCRIYNDAYWAKPSSKRRAKLALLHNPIRLTPEQWKNVVDKRNAGGYWKKQQLAGVRRFLDSLTPEQLAKRSNRCVDIKRYITGKLETRFGKIFYASGLEKTFLEYAVKAKQVLNLKRDTVVRYRFGGKLRRYLLDFTLTLAGGKRVFAEPKNAYCLNPEHHLYEQTQAKIRAGRRFARKHGGKFFLLTSNKDIRRLFSKLEKEVTN